MKVGELIVQLQKFPLDMEVVSLGPDSGGYGCELGTINTVEVYLGGLMVAHIDDEDWRE